MRRSTTAIGALLASTMVAPGMAAGEDRIGAGGEEDARHIRLSVADPKVMATMSGLAVPLRVESGGPGSPVLNPDAAARLGLVAGPVPARLRVGSVRVPGSVARLSYTLSGVGLDRRVLWYDRPVVPAPLWGEVGPYGLPQDKVEFVLRPPVAGERTFTFPIADEGLDGPMAHVRVGERRIAVRFDLSRQQTLATAAAASDLAAEFGGELAGSPQRIPIYLGITRPLRRLQLARPLRFGPLRFDWLWARVGDYGDISAIPESEIDPGEILVKGRNDGDVLRRIQIGTDALAACSSVMIDKKAREIVLKCRPSPE